MALWILSGTTGVIRYKKKHTYGGHQSSPICFLHLLWSMASYLFNLRASQSCRISFQVFFALSLGLAPSLRTPYISSPNHCLLLAAHAHTIATCFAVLLRLCHLILVSLKPLPSSLTPHIWPFSSLPTEVPPHFPFLQAMSHFHATYYFENNCCTVPLSLLMIYPYL